MRIASGKVVAGKIVVEGAPFEEGANVTVIETDEKTFEVEPEEKAALLEAIAETDRGETVDAAEFLAKLRSRK